MVVHKSEEMEILAKENGWETQLDIDTSKFEQTLELSDMVWTLYAKRGEKKVETLKVSWTGDLQSECFYKFGDYVLRPVRKAPVIALLTGQPKLEKYCREKDNSEKTREERIADRELPFDNDSSAFDILVNVVGKNITWIDRFGIEHTESAPKESNLRKPYFRVKTTQAGKRVLEWANTSGFHACYVTDIVSVG